MALAPQHMFMVLTKRADRMKAYMLERWKRPLPNVWLGVSTEDQKRADERIPDLQATPAAIRWVSAEPLLGPIDVRSYVGRVIQAFDARETELLTPPVRLDWIVVGGESGRAWRPMKAEWMADIAEACRTARVAFFAKQMAGKADIPDNLMIRQFPR
jgi:protein gp37